MSRTFYHGERKIRVRAIRKDPPDLRRLARALIALVEAEAEAEAEAQEAARKKSAPKKKPTGSPGNVTSDDEGGAS
jgi:hypothetical protein